ncbi:MAG: hypothetical protein JZU58_24410 [Curvibacter lanceolatus]|uniref:hypothetical protein n=1 Tax=Curvibacter lanceolatus TaxID=86182 RepID=UPI002354E2AB|nr:hypothetical protein [Curvibacter lanceolatus]MBV5295491.1 hypothetical protein [Curvibacter lanceolatus]
MMGPTYQPSTIAILKHLQQHGPLTVDEFGKLKHIGTTAPGVRVASMVKRGTVARVDMSRPARYAITKRGVEAVNAVANGQGNLVPRTLIPVAQTPAVVPTAQLLPAPACRASVESYKAPELRPFDGRPGAMDAFALPSRMGKSLQYRDGRTEAAA